MALNVNKLCIFPKLWYLSFSYYFHKKNNLFLNSSTFDNNSEDSCDVEIRFLNNCYTELIHQRVTHIVFHSQGQIALLWRAGRVASQYSKNFNSYNPISYLRFSFNACTFLQLWHLSTYFLQLRWLFYKHITQLCPSHSTPSSTYYDTLQPKIPLSFWLYSFLILDKVPMKAHKKRQYSSTLS